MNIDKQLETVLVTFCDLVVANRRRYDETGKDDYIAILDEAKSALKKLINGARIDAKHEILNELAWWQAHAFNNNLDFDWKIAVETLNAMKNPQRPFIEVNTPINSLKEGKDT